MVHAVIAADVVSLMVMFVILCGTFFNSKNRKESTRLYNECVLVAALGTSIDIAGYALEGKPYLDTVLLVVNALSYIFVAVLLVFYSTYVVAVIKEKADISYKVIIPVTVMVILDIIILVAGTVTGKLFVIRDHAYVPGELNAYTSILPALALIYIYYILFIYRESLGAGRLIAISTYMVFPLVTAVLSFFTSAPDFAYVSIVISLEVIYVVIQVQTIAETNLRAQILSEASYTDPLTGLKNRRALDEMLKKSGENSPVGVVFCDLNYLKHINDNLGHQAGDDYIRKFTDMLTEQFPDAEVCRTSGDEFVVLLCGIAEEAVDKRMSKFRKLVDESDRIASFGYVYSEDGDPQKMISEAEKLMYEDKARYYRETGRDRRK